MTPPVIDLSNHNVVLLKGGAIDFQAAAATGRMIFVVTPESPVGTSRTWRDVRDESAVRGKADIEASL
jgi:hypothetical protein